MEHKRPLSLSIIGWYFIISAAFSLISLSVMMDNPTAKALLEANILPISIQRFLQYAGMAASCISGYGILKGYNWSRLLYVGHGILTIGIGALTSPIKSILLVSLIFLAFFSYFLFNAKGNAWFGKIYLKQGTNDAPNA